jgi:hypothetical protein
MLISTKPDADILRGGAVERIGHLLFATYPHPRIACIDSGRHTLVAHRSGFIQNRSYGFSGMHLPLRLLNKLPVGAPKPSGWHHTHGVGPIE